MSDMYHSTQWTCILFCALGMVGMGSANHNDSDLPIKYLTGTADLKTPLAVSYFLDETRRTDGDSTTKITTRNAHQPADVHGSEKHRLLATKAHHLGQMFDLRTSPTVIREVQEWGSHDAQKPNNRDVDSKTYYKVYVPNQRPKTQWEPSVYTLSIPQTNTNQYQYKAIKPIIKREPQPINIYNQQYNNLRSGASETLPLQHGDYKESDFFKIKNDKSKGDDSEEDNSDEDEDEKDFLPTRMYAQVRQFESESHLPRNEEEPKLKKIVKDSRIHTVYMEEGYEDGAYDHAGEENHAEEEEAQVEHRRRRRHIDASLTDVEIDTDLIGKNQFVLGERNNEADKKYPYYKKKNINNDSPLRYAQDINSIPRKMEGDMTFYEESHKRTKCDEVVDNVAPIPKVLDSGDESPKKTTVPSLPRLKKLGDKIDCFKIRFFGEEPFDNPLFKEELVGSPKELFTDPDVKLIENNLKVLNRTGKTFQPLAVEASGFPTIEKNTEEDSENSQNDSDGAAKDGKEQVTDEVEFQLIPEAEALHMRRVTRRRPRPYQNKLSSGRYAAYRLNRKSSPTHKLPPGTTPPTVQTSPNVISEVYYKTLIKPSEQLNVFSDVINHIQNMSRGDSYTEPSEQRAHAVPLSPLILKPHTPTINMKLRRGQRKKLMRKYPVMKSTQQLYTDFMHRNKNSPSRQSDVPTAQETWTVNVGTVQIPSSYSSVDLPSFMNNAEVIRQYTTIDLPLNKYLVPGMKPPLAVGKPMIYSDFQNDNNLKRKDWLSNHRISRRKRAIKNYMEIRRQPASRPKETEQNNDDDDDDDDDDDYVPHRPTSYHYDPDTDRIIYDKKPTTEKSVEEIVEEYFEEDQEEPEEVTTKKAPVPHRTVYHKDVLNKDNGKTLLDFLAQLKSDPSYKAIEDSEPVKVTTTTTPKPGPTTPPEFLKFLAKLHSSDEYKKIDNPEDIEDNPTTKKTETTTAKAIVEDMEEVEEEPVQAGSVQNSPGGQFSQDGTLQIFDINDYLPKVKTYTPKTSINYSKYKTIERTTTRHTLSSRYSEEDELQHTSTIASVAPRYQTAPPRSKPAIPQTDDEEKLVKIEEIVTEPSSTSTTTTTSAPKIRVRGRRPSSQPSRTTTFKPQDDITTAAAVENYTPATHRPPSRVYPRRQHPKIRFRPTTRASSNKNDNDEESSKTERTIRRRNGVPANHKPDYTPVTISKRIDDHPTMIIQRQARLVTPEIINYHQTAGSMISQIDEINPRQRSKQYIITQLTTQMAPTETDKGTLTEKINIDDSNFRRENRNIDRSDNTVALEGVKFIKDPNKRLYFYAPL